MRTAIICLATALLFAACKHKETPIVKASFVDSLLNNYSEPVIAKSNELDMKFWMDRMNSQPPGMVNELRYASTLLLRYHLYGDIHDAKKADSIVTAVDNRFNRTESSISLSLAAYSILQHRFKEAKDYLTFAKFIGARKYSVLLTSFDVYFELGQYDSAKRML